MRYELKDRAVLVTGASSGIGRACAVEYHSHGCRVLAVARSADRLESLVSELGTDRVAAFPCDITDPTQRRAAVHFATEHFGGVDILVNNAGWASFGTVQRMPEDHLRRMVELNLLAPVAMIQEVLPDMLTRGHGQIVNVSSVVGAQAIPRMTFYSATKAAINAISTGLRMELRGTGVDVILVAPSSTRTAFFDSAATLDTKAVRFAETQYSPQRVARAVVRASRRRRRQITLSAEGKAISLIRRLSHRLADAIMYQVAKRAMPGEELPGHGNTTVP